MNKTSTLFAGVGILIIVVIGYFSLKTNPKQEQLNPDVNANQATPTNSFIEAVFEYKNGQADPKVVRVEEGQNIKIRVNFDVAGEAHLHGYDLSVDVEPGKESILEFTASKTGRFPMEFEQLKKDIGVIEVYPK